MGQATIYQDKARPFATFHVDWWLSQEYVCNLHSVIFPSLAEWHDKATLRMPNDHEISNVAESETEWIGIIYTVAPNCRMGGVNGDGNMKSISDCQAIGKVFWLAKGEVSLALPFAIPQPKNRARYIPWREKGAFSKAAINNIGSSNSTANNCGSWPGLHGECWPSQQARHHTPDVPVSIVLQAWRVVVTACKSVSA